MIDPFDSPIGRHFYDDGDPEDFVCPRCEGLGFINIEPVRRDQALMGEDGPPTEADVVSWLELRHYFRQDREGVRACPVCRSTE